MTFASCSNLTNLIIEENTILNCWGYCLFDGDSNLTSIPNANWIIHNGYRTFFNCSNLVDIPYMTWNNVTEFSYTFCYCNNLSDTSIQNIINSFLNGTYSTSVKKNLNCTNQYSPFCHTNITNDRFQNRWAELDAAGWTY